MIDSIVELFNKEIRDALINAEVGDFVIRPSEKMNKERLEETINWMHTFIKGEVREFKEVWALRPKEVWGNYKLFKLDDLVEVKMLREATTKLKNAWTSRPSTIRRMYYDAGTEAGDPGTDQDSTVTDAEEES